MDFPFIFLTFLLLFKIPLNFSGVFNLNLIELLKVVLVGVFNTEIYSITNSVVFERVEDFVSVGSKVTSVKVNNIILVKIEIQVSRSGEKISKIAKVFKVLYFASDSFVDFLIFLEKIKMNFSLFNRTGPFSIVNFFTTLKGIVPAFFQENKI